MHLLIELLIFLINHSPLRRLNSRHWLILFVIVPVICGFIGLLENWQWGVILFFLSQSIMMLVLFALIRNIPDSDKIPLGELWRNPVRFVQPPEKDS